MKSSFPSVVAAADVGALQNVAAVASPEVFTASDRAAVLRALGKEHDDSATKY